MVSPEIIERIRDALPLVDFIGRDVSLKRAGSIWKGLCPFHNERTPSFAVVFWYWPPELSLELPPVVLFELFLGLLPVCVELLLLSSSSFNSVFET